MAGLILLMAFAGDAFGLDLAPCKPCQLRAFAFPMAIRARAPGSRIQGGKVRGNPCLLYTSDAADD